MKSIKLFKVIALLAIPFFFITSCEDEKGLTSSDYADSQGFIEVELDGESESGKIINKESFKATKFEENKRNKISETPDKNWDYEIDLYRVVDIAKYENIADMDIRYYSDGDSAKVRSFGANYMKELEDQKVLDLSFESFYGYNNEAKLIEDFEFDEDTYELSGSFKVSHTYYDSDNTINADVEFEAQPKMIVSK